MNKKYLTLTIIVVVAAVAIYLILVRTLPPETEVTDEVTLQLFWLHQAQFAGFYSAKENGYYKKEGIDISFLEGGVPVDETKVVVEGLADFGVASAGDILEARDRGLPVVILGVVYKKNPLAWVALEESGIIRLEDIVGKRVGLLSINDDIAINAMLRKRGLEPGSVIKVDIQDYTGNETLLARTIDFYPAYLTNQVIDYENRGIGINLFTADDYEVSIYADTIFTTESMLRENPDLVKRFLSATLKGWEFAVRNPERAAEFALAQAEASSFEHELAQMEKSIPLIVISGERLLEIKPGIITEMTEMLKEGGVLGRIIPETEIVDSSFLEEIYREL